jgi:RecA/RadA recombinase
VVFEALRNAKSWLENRRRYGIEVLTSGQQAVYRAVESEFAGASAKLLELEALNQRITKLTAELQQSDTAVSSLFSAYEALPKSAEVMRA